MNGFDFDGVINFSGNSGIYPGPGDIIITGRSFDEAHYVNGILKERGITNAVYFNPMTTEKRQTGTETSRKNSGRHKAVIIKLFENHGIFLDKFFEDDELQIAEIKKLHPALKIVHVVSDTVK